MADYGPRYFATPEGRAKNVASSKRYATTARGKAQANASRRRRAARRRGLPADLTVDQWDACLAHFDHASAYCGSPDDLTQEHVVPVADGGGYTASNIVPGCRSCNSRKYTTPLAVWYPAQPFFDPARLLAITGYLEAQEMADGPEQPIGAD